MGAIEGAGALGAQCDAAALEVLVGDVLSSAFDGEVSTGFAAGDIYHGQQQQLQSVVDMDAALQLVLRAAQVQVALELSERLPRVLGEVEIQRPDDVPLDEFTAFVSRCCPGRFTEQQLLSMFSSAHGCARFTSTGAFFAADDGCDPLTADDVRFF